MSSESVSDRPELEIKSDEDWKERVKAEDARRDAEAAASQAAASQSSEAAEGAAAGQKSTGRESEAGDIDPAHLPPASFLLIVEMLSTQAMVALGLIPEPGSKEPKVRINLARHLIDLLGVLEEKTQGNLDDSEKRQLDRTLHQLRMMYVERSRG